MASARRLALGSAGPSSTDRSSWIKILHSQYRHPRLYVPFERRMEYLIPRMEDRQPAYPERAPIRRAGAADLSARASAARSPDLAA
jgi:hypothetical protein